MPNNILGHKHEIQGLPINCYSKSLFKTVVQQCMCKYALEFLGRVVPSIYVEQNFLSFCQHMSFCRPRKVHIWNWSSSRRKKKMKNITSLCNTWSWIVLETNQFQAFIDLWDAISSKFISTFMPGHGSIKLKRHLTFLRFWLSLRNKRNGMKIVQYWCSD